MTDLPDGWDTRALGDIADIVRGVTYKKSDAKSAPGPGYSPLLRATNIGSSLDLGGDLVYVPTMGVKLQQFLRCGDIVLASSSGSLSVVGKNAALRADWDGTFGAFCSVIRSRCEVDSRYLALYLSSHPVRQRWSEAARGTNINNLKKSDLAPTPVPFPPLDEQRRIVDILEDHLSRLDAAESALTRSRVRLKRFHQASLVACLSAAAAESASTTQTTVGALARVGTGATPLKSRTDYYAGGSIPWVTSADLAQGLIERANHFVTDLALEETAIKLWPVGTILVAMYGEGKTRGTVAELGIAATTNQACAAIELHDSDPSLRSWIRLVLDSSYWSMRRMASGGVQPNLNLGLVRSIEVPVPFPETRARLLRAREAHLDAQQMLATELALSEIRARSLRRSLLAAAFAGRLTGRSTDMELVEEMAGV